MATLSRRERTADARQAKERAFLDATISLLEEGTAFADLGVEQIVKRAGFSRPTFYAYFDDRRDLVLRLGDALQEDLAAVAEPWLTAAGGTLDDTLRAVLDVFRRHRAAVGALTEAATYDADVRAFWLALHERFLPITRERVAAGNPLLGPKAVAARAFALIWMTERTLTEHVASPTVDEGALIDQLTWIWGTAVGTQT